MSYGVTVTYVLNIKAKCTCLYLFIQGRVLKVHTSYVTHMQDISSRYEQQVLGMYDYSLMGIFVSGIYFATVCKVGGVVCFIFTYLCKNVSSVCPYSILSMQAIFGMWSHICSVMSNMCTVLLVEWLAPVTSYVAYMCGYIPYICLLNIWHLWHMNPIWWLYLFLACIWQ